MDNWRETLSKAMAELGVTKASISDVMGSSPPQVTRLFQDGSNPTVDTLERMAHAAGLAMVITFEPLPSIQPSSASGGPSQRLAVYGRGRARVCRHGTIFGAGCSLCGR